MKSLREYQATLPEIITHSDKAPFVFIDEDKLDIFRKTEIEIPAWEPIQCVPEFDTCSYICLDIETTGLGNSNSKNYINADFNPGLDTIKMVGMKSELGSYKIFSGNDERNILRNFVHVLTKKKPNYLFTYNGWNFDLPFLISRLNFYKIKHPFKYARNPSCMSAAQMFGKPQIFHQIFLNWEDGTQTYIVDLYFQVLAWDFVARKLVGWSLKTVPVQLELREESDRLELSYSDILECYRINDWDRLEIYLKDDLDDTERIAKHLFPAVHYQQLIIPEFNPQQLHIYGNGSKLNKFLTNFYISEGLPIPDTDEAHRFKGGRTEAFCGFFKNTTKCDVASLYPTIMLNYGLCSVKDQINILLGALKYLTEVRLWHKANAKDTSKSPEERRKSKQLEGAFKVIINSCFAYETLVLTDKGLFEIGSLKGQTRNVLNGNGEWKPAKFDSYGSQQIWELTVQNGFRKEVVRTTENHRWLAAPYSRTRKDINVDGQKRKIRIDKINYTEYQTSDLKPGMIIPSNAFPGIETENQEYRDGLFHGIIYGDGHFSDYKTYKNRFGINLANCKSELKEYLVDSEKVRIISHIPMKRDDLDCLINFELLTGFDFKSLPDTTNHSYLLGFFRGLMSTDGCVESRDGEISISGDKTISDWLNKYSQIIGYSISSIQLNHESGVRKNIIKGQSVISTNDNYLVKFSKYGFTENDFLRIFHRENFLNNQKQVKFQKRNLWRVVSVVETTDVEEVYCCNEPETHIFTLGSNIKTQNCYGFLGAKGLEFNDYKTAAMVTAYGRKILKFMMDHVLVQPDTIIVNMDTDAVAYSCPKGQERVIYESLKAALPEWIKIDFEWNADVFIPATIKLKEFEKKYILDSYHGRNFLQKWFENLTIAETQLCLMKFCQERVSLDLFFKISKMLNRDFLTSDGLRKNYIVFLDEGGVKLFGKYKKRDRSVLMKTFPVEYLTRYRNDPSSAEMYYEEVKAQIDKNVYPVENLAITRKIRKGEKKLLEVFEDKDEGDVVTFYKTIENFALLGSKESYSSEEYLEELETLVNEILDAIFIQSVTCTKDEKTMVAA